MGRVPNPLALCPDGLGSSPPLGGFVDVVLGASVGGFLQGKRFRERAMRRVALLLEAWEASLIFCVRLVRSTPAE
jgi:hypothetical protein